MPPKKSSPGQVSKSANWDKITTVIAAKQADVTKQTAAYKQQEEYNYELEALKLLFNAKYTDGPNLPKATLSDFDILTTIGEGAFGCVVLGKHKQNRKCYAIKIMSKTNIINDKGLPHLMNEKRILASCKFPFLVNLEFCFKDNCNVFFALPFISGESRVSSKNDFNKFFKHRTGRIKELDAKFYAAQIVLALEYLHYMDVLYRDLKPENIVMDTDGYLKITDFGFCKVVKTRTYTLCGTPEYIAPEVLHSKGYGKSADWWSFGVFIYEIVGGFTPFYAKGEMKIFEKITLGTYSFPKSFSNELRDLIKNLLIADLSRRYGILKNGVYDIKSHKWFETIDWLALYSKKSVAPYIPLIKSDIDTTNFDKFHSPKIETSDTEKYTNEFADF